MNADQYLLSELGIMEIDSKICQREVKSFRCCFDIKGQNNCMHFLDLVIACYRTKGRKVNKRDEFQFK